MGGLGGHIKALFEDTSLSFGSLVEIMQTAANGKAWDVYEKTDGQNLFVTWDQKTDTLRYARNKGNLSTGGMTLKELSEKFSGKELVHDAFVNGANALEKGMFELPHSTKKKIFSEKVWYSIEIIAKDNPNVIHYDVNTIAFHKFGPKRFIDDGFKSLRDDDAYAHLDIVQQSLVKLHHGASKVGWNIVGPLKIVLPPVSDSSALDRFLKGVENLENIRYEDTIRTYLFNQMMQEKLKRGPLTRRLQLDLASRLLEDEGCKTKTNLLKNANTQEQKAFIQKMFEEWDMTLHNLLAPIELLIYNFSIERMSGLQSALIIDGQKEIARVKYEVEATIEKIKKSDDSAGKLFVNSQIKRLGNINNIKTTIEGLTFKHKNVVYKMTGAFGPVNQILGFYRFKRIVK